MEKKREAQSNLKPIAINSQMTMTGGNLRMTQQLGGSMISPSAAGGGDDNPFLGEDNDLEDTEEVEKLSIEQMKSKVRYQGLLLHFFQ